MILGKKREDLQVHIVNFYTPNSQGLPFLEKSFLRGAFSNSNRIQIDGNIGNENLISDWILHPPVLVARIR